MNILKIIANFFAHNKNTYHKKDIVWAKRYSSDIEEESIPLGHREGPYIILSKKRSKYYTLSCTGTTTNIFNKYLLNKDKYSLNKDSYVYLNKVPILSNDRIIRKIDILDNSDMNSIIKRLIVLNNKHKNKETFKILKKHKFYYDIGDIIKYDNKTFYVYDLDEYNLYTHQVYYSIKSKHIFIINGTSYAFNFENTKVISLKKRIKLTDIVKVESQSFINNYKNRFLRELKEKHSVGKGKLISIDNDYYYVYNITERYIHTYRVYLDKDKSNHKIKISNKDYYTNFISTKLSIDVTSKVVSIATLKEIKKIQNKKKYIKGKLNNKPTILSEYKKQMIIINQDTLDKCVITNRVGNIITYVSLTDNKVYEHTLKNSIEFNYKIYEIMDKIEFYNIIKRIEKRD